MTTIHSAYQNALLADATYALEVDGLQNTSGTELKDILKDRMTPAVAKSTTGSGLAKQQNYINNTEWQDL